MPALSPCHAWALGLLHLDRLPVVAAVDASSGRGQACVTALGVLETRPLL